MSVFISNEDLRRYELAGINEEALKDTINKYRQEGVPDEEIQMRASAKAYELEKSMPTVDTKLGRFLTGATAETIPFGDTINRGAAAVKSAYNAGIDYLSGNNEPTVRQYLEAPEGTEPQKRSFSDLYKENYDNQIKKIENTVKEQEYDIGKGAPVLRYGLPIAGNIAGYGLMPGAAATKIAVSVPLAATESFQAGYNKTPEERIQNALIGGGVAAVATPALNKIGGRNILTGEAPSKIINISKIKTGNVLKDSLKKIATEVDDFDILNDDVIKLLAKTQPWERVDNLTAQIKNAMKNDSSGEVYKMFKQSAEDHVKRGGFKQSVLNDFSKAAENFEGDRAIINKYKDAIAENINKIDIEDTAKVLSDGEVVFENADVVDQITEALSGLKKQISPEAYKSLEKDIFSSSMASRMSKSINRINDEMIKQYVPKGLLAPVQRGIEYIPVVGRISRLLWPEVGRGARGMSTREGKKIIDTIESSRRLAEARANEDIILNLTGPNKIPNYNYIPRAPEADVGEMTYESIYRNLSGKTIPKKK